MDDQRLIQIQYEINTWKRSLNFIIDENINLKNRLAEILKNGFERKQLEPAEYFQNKFISEDEQIGILRNDLGEITKNITTDNFANGASLKIIKKIDALRNSIKNTEKNFSELKSEFNNYLFELYLNEN